MLLAWSRPKSGVGVTAGKGVVWRLGHPGHGLAPHCRDEPGQAEPASLGGLGRPSPLSRVHTDCLLLHSGPQRSFPSFEGSVPVPGLGVLWARGQTRSPAESRGQAMCPGGVLGHRGCPLWI